jgi:hypothetical protein
LFPFQPRSFAQKLHHKATQLFFPTTTTTSPPQGIAEPFNNTSTYPYHSPYPSPSLAHTFPSLSIIIITIRILVEKADRISKSASIHVTSRTTFVQSERLIPVKVYYIFAIQSANILHGHLPTAYPKLSSRCNLGL